MPSQTAEIALETYVEEIVLPKGGWKRGANAKWDKGPALFPTRMLVEQAAIAAYLDAETGELDALVGKVEAAVERLQEYRTALITAAVTGKFDVRSATKRNRKGARYEN